MKVEPKSIYFLYFLNEMAICWMGFMNTTQHYHADSWTEMISSFITSNLHSLFIRSWLTLMKASISQDEAASTASSPRPNWLIRGPSCPDWRALLNKLTAWNQTAQFKTFLLRKNTPYSIQFNFLLLLLHGSHLRSGEIWKDYGIFTFNLSVS